MNGVNAKTICYVIALKNLGSVKAAAEYCNISPGTLSKQITILEERLHMKIFRSRGPKLIINHEAYEAIDIMECIVRNLNALEMIRNNNLKSS